MKIYSMTATFGKLDNQTLTLQPGLNVISAPNEWGKSTWCAFLAIMLYGLDTREKTTKTNLAAKERYAPWSGSPMSGRMELNWNGRDITLERWTKGRTPLGEFRAYETASGLPVEELTAANCGEMLLGVERSVFLRAGFLRLSDLPVTQDESLRRRLNALVTTGDESNAGDVLAQKLRDLKNKCRYNRSGLIPQAQMQAQDLQNKLTEWKTLQTQSEAIRSRQQELEGSVAALENHRQALQYAAAQNNLHRVEDAHMALEAAAGNMARLEDACAMLPPRETAVENLQRHAMLQQAFSESLQELQALPPEPAQPAVPQRYESLSGQEAVARAEGDFARYNALESKKKKNQFIWMLYIGLSVLLVILELLLQLDAWVAIGAAIALGGVAVICFSFARTGMITKKLHELMDRYPGIGPQQWVEDAEFYAQTQSQYVERLQNTANLRQKVQQRIDQIECQSRELTAGQEAHSWMLRQNEIIAQHDALLDARREHQRCAAHTDALRAMIQPVQAPAQPDTLSYSEAETARLLSEATYEQRQLHMRLGQYQGRMDALGDQTALQKQHDAVIARLEKLEQTYHALELALHTLEDATAQLQRRFAPRIAQAAQEIFSRLTAGRYDRLMLQQDLSIHAGAAEESVLRAAQWRSEGTVDQLYLALRLAVARELTPDAPLVLDDALVRFDDARHGAAMEILHEEAKTKQIILFTCQSREQ